MRLLIAGGGTGGHLYPGVAVAEELLARGGHAVHFAGTDRGLEARVLPALGMPFTSVRAAGMVGKGLGGAVRAVGALALGVFDSLGLVRRFRPHACLGVGGYASFPVVVVARLLGVPVTVQEQNAMPGLSNRMLSHLARRVYAGDPAAVAQLPAKKTWVTGNPLRRGLSEGLPYQAPAPVAPLHLLVVGGSQGAASLNRSVPPAVRGLSCPMEVRHQAGRGNAPDVVRRYAGLQGVEVVEYIEDMEAAYRWAHLVVSRAGALSVAELAAAGRPAVLVPYPFAAGGHQEANARAAADRGAAVCVPDSLLDRGGIGVGLAGTLAELLAEPDRLPSMAAKAAAGAHRHAARDIVDDLLSLARG